MLLIKCCLNISVRTLCERTSDTLYAAGAVITVLKGKNGLIQRMSCIIYDYFVKKKMDNN